MLEHLPTHHVIKQITCLCLMAMASWRDARILGIVSIFMSLSFNQLSTTLSRTNRPTNGNDADFAGIWRRPLTSVDEWNDMENNGSWPTEWNEWKPGFPQSRQKREFYTLKNVIKHGKQVVKALLRDALPVPSSRKLRKFRKNGGIRQLSADFFNNKPLPVQEFEFPFKVSGKAGRVADRIFVAKPQGPSGKPTLEIFMFKDIRHFVMEKRLTKQPFSDEDLEHIEHEEITYLSF